MSQPAFYHIEVHPANAIVSVQINGFPVVENKDNSETFDLSIPVQMYLAGKDNLLEVTAETFDKSEPGTVEVNIVPYEQGDITDTSEKRVGVAELSMEVGAEPATSITTFDNEGHDYSYLFKEAAEISNEEALTYGKELYKYLENGDAQSFVNQMKYQLRDMANAYGYSEQQVKEGLMQQLSKAFFSGQTCALSEVTLSAVKYSEGRIWEIQVNDEEFLKKKEEGGASQMPVYVARINGEMTIVR